METENEDKKHKPTGKRLNELHEKGVVMRSKDMTGGLIFLCSVIAISFMSTQFRDQFQNNFIQLFDSIDYAIDNTDVYFAVVKAVIYKNFMMLVPLFVVILGIVFLSPFLFGGWNFTLDSVSFKPEKFNVVANIANLFSFKKASVEMVKSFVKSTLLLGILVVFIMQKYNTIMSLSTVTLNASMAMAYNIIFDFIVWLLAGVVIIAAIDVAYNYISYQMKHKMSSQEVKDENKDMEGNVEVKRKIRSKQLMMYKQKLMQLIPKANVIITNPTHYAVALQYNENRDNAPRVIAKGKGIIAQQIRHLAVINAVPIYEAPPLARSIYFTTKIGREIHPGLYMAVAIVLSYVYQLKNYQMGNGQLPKHVSDLEIPNELIYNE